VRERERVREGVRPSQGIVGMPRPSPDDLEAGGASTSRASGGNSRASKGAVTGSTDLATIPEHPNVELPAQPVATGAAGGADHDITRRRSPGSSFTGSTDRTEIREHPIIDTMASFTGSHEWRSVDEAAVTTFWGEEHNQRFFEDSPLEFAMWQYNPRTFIIINFLISFCYIAFVVSTHPTPSTPNPEP
jgi:hypothetical protein